MPRGSGAMERLPRLRARRASASLPRMRVEAAGRTDVGLRREHNEDALLVLPEFGLAVVCDGLGGPQAGEVASAMAVETVRLFFERTRDPEATWPLPYDESRDEATNLLEGAVQWARRRIREAPEHAPQRK